MDPQKIIMNNKALKKREKKNFDTFGIVQFENST